MQFYSISSSNRVWLFLWTSCFLRVLKTACSTLNAVCRGPLLLSWQVNNLRRMAFSVDKCAVVPVCSTALYTGGCALARALWVWRRPPGRSFLAYSGRHFCRPQRKKPASPKRNGFHASAAREQQAGYGAVTKRLPIGCQVVTRCHSPIGRAAPASPSPLPVGGCLLLAGHCGVRGAGAAGCGVRHCPGWSQSMPPALPMPLPYP